MLSQHWSIVVQPTKFWLNVGLMLFNQRDNDIFFQRNSLCWFNVSHTSKSQQNTAIVDVTLIFMVVVNIKVTKLSSYRLKIKHKFNISKINVRLPRDFLEIVKIYRPFSFIKPVFEICRNIHCIFVQIKKQNC